MLVFQHGNPSWASLNCKCKKEDSKRLSRERDVTGIKKRHENYKNGLNIHPSCIPSLQCAARPWRTYRTQAEITNMSLTMHTHPIKQGNKVFKL